MPVVGVITGGGGPVARASPWSVFEAGVPCCSVAGLGRGAAGVDRAESVAGASAWSVVSGCIRTGCSAVTWCMTGAVGCAAVMAGAGGWDARLTITTAVVSGCCIPGACNSRRANRLNPTWISSDTSSSRRKAPMRRKGLAWFMAASCSTFLQTVAQRWGTKK